jgi:RNA polymerase sigma-70 factor (ECF subfamily)
MRAMSSGHVALPLLPESPGELSDVDVVDQVVRGHLELFQVLVQRYNAVLYRVGIAYLRNHAQTEDAMQNAYVKAFTGLEHFKRTAAFRTWLTRIMINECLMLLRPQSRFRTTSLEGDGTANEIEKFARPAIDPVRTHELKALLERAVDALPRTYRAVYLLREMQQFTTAETADCLGLSHENVKVCLHRARLVLKARLQKSAEYLELFDYPAIFCGPMTANVMRSILASRVPSE